MRVDDADIQSKKMPVQLLKESQLERRGYQDDILKIQQHFKPEDFLRNYLEREKGQSLFELYAN